MENKMRSVFKSRRIIAKHFASKYLTTPYETFLMILNGEVLPPPRLLMEICEVLGEPPTKLYRRNDIDLMRIDRLYKSRHGGGMEQQSLFAPKRSGNPELRVRVPQEEIDELRNDMQQLGYEDYAQWHKDMRDRTHARRIREDKKHGRTGK